GILYENVLAPQPTPTAAFSPWAMIIGGFLVGFGTRMGSGCTSGHGVCGLGRLSMRSLVAVLTFMITAILTVFVVRHVLRLSI
ncbi:YeeE/YedE family protein, partial [Planktothrix sp. FACHB-1355]